jgi:hypothetical protein
MHNDGLVDDRYLRVVPTTDLRLGQRVIVSEALARRAIKEGTRLCEVLASDP